MKRTLLAVSLLSLACKREAPVEDKAEPKPEKPAASAEPAKKKPAKVKVAPPPISMPSDKKVDFGGKETRVVVCSLDASAPVMADKDWWFHAITSMALAKDGSLYAVDHENKLRHYINQSKDGCELALDPDFGKGGVMDFDSKRGSIVNSCAVDGKGAVYFSWHKAPKKIVDGKVTDFCGSFVKASWSSPLVVSDGNLVDGDKCTGKYVQSLFTGFDPSVPDYDKPKLVGLFGEELVSHGVDKEKGKDVHKVGVHSLEGKRRLVLGGHEDDAMWSVKDAVQCGDDLCVLDSPLSSTSVLRWTKDGKFLGKLKLNEVDLSMNAASLGWSKAGLWVAGAVRAEKGNDWIGVITLLPGV